MCVCNSHLISFCIDSDKHFSFFLLVYVILGLIWSPVLIVKTHVSHSEFDDITSRTHTRFFHISIVKNYMKMRSPFTLIICGGRMKMADGKRKRSTFRCTLQCSPIGNEWLDYNGIHSRFILLHWNNNRKNSLFPFHWIPQCQYQSNWLHYCTYTFNFR